MTPNIKLPFSGSPIDPIEVQRNALDIQDYLRAPTASCLLFHKGNPALTSDGRIMRCQINSVNENEIREQILLGLEDQEPVFAIEIKEPNSKIPENHFHNLRAVAGRLNPTELALAGQAKSLLDWHRDHQFCSNCGSPSKSDLGGLKRNCKSCATDHFPRVNPVVIMLVQHGDNILLAQGKNWPPHAMSTPAGFVSPGETVEEAAAREIYEEVGLVVKNVQYIFSQPWPFGSQLMMGVACETDAPKINLNKDEIEDARWFTRAEVRSVFSAHKGGFELYRDKFQQKDSKDVKLFRRPPEFAISYQLLRYWLEQ